MRQQATYQKKADMVEIFTDGACSGNPGPGGYGAILKYGQKTKEISGCADKTTNNRMEMVAVIEALRQLKRAVNRFRGKTLRSVRWVYSQRLQLIEKVVPGPNEDALTAGTQSLIYAMRRAGIKPNQIDALFVVSESYPYAVKSSTAIAGKAGLTDLKYGVRGEFACKPFGEFLDIGYYFFLGKISYSLLYLSAFLG